MSSDFNQLYEFGDFRIDLRKGLLLHRGVPVPVPPKAFETLIALVESDGRVVSKDELIAKVWAGMIVEENNLTQQISLLRKLLGDPGQSTIETVPRRGYRFAAAVREVPPPSVETVESVAEVQRPPSRSWKIPIAVAVAAIIISVTSIAIFRARRGDMPRTIAVLPFKPLVPGSGDVYLQLGMADALITDLSNVREIRVRPTSSVIMYTAAADPAAIGEKLGVDAVLDGRIQNVGDRVRVTAQLIRVKDGAPLWAGKFDEDRNNILALQDAISAWLVSALTLNLTRDEKRSLEKHATDNAEAYQLYLRGRYHWWRWTPEEWSRSRDFFEQAVAKDPKFALAWCGLADAIGVQVWFRPPREVAPRAKAAAARALEIDNTLPDAYCSLAPMALFYDWDYPAAERLLRKAIALNPNHALSHDLYALTLVSGRHVAEAVAESRRALELDPTSPYMNTDLGQIYYYQRDFEKSSEQVSIALAIDPNYADGLRYLASIAEQKKNEAGAIDAWARFHIASGDAEIASAIRSRFAAGGYKAALHGWLDALTAKSAKTYVAPLDMADVYARLGESEEALTWLRKAMNERSPGLIWISVEPRWDPYRSDPRFQAMLGELHLR
jgi:DNA-binding winged helix-turn-helix (wHTH) protein/TolB-like protein/Tfp pilus assembly protein PilF